MEVGEDGRLFWAVANPVSGEGQRKTRFRRRLDLLGRLDEGRRHRCRREPRPCLRQVGLG